MEMSIKKPVEVKSVITKSEVVGVIVFLGRGEEW